MIPVILHKIKGGGYKESEKGTKNMQTGVFTVEFFSTHFHFLLFRFLPVLYVGPNLFYKLKGQRNPEKNEGNIKKKKKGREKGAETGCCLCERPYLEFGDLLPH
jgi:hypothetical protein